MYSGKRKQTGPYQTYQQALKRTKKAAAPNVGPYKKQNAFKQQAMRTGGWANPQRAEVKFIDTTPSFTLSVSSNTWVATPQLLNGSIQGTEAVNRLGRKITLTSLYVKGNLLLAPTGTLGGYCRIAVVYDKQANGTAPSITDVFLANDLNSPNNMTNSDRFIKVADFETGIVSQNGDCVAPIEFYRKLNLETCYNTGNAGTIGDIASGSLYMFVCNNGNFTTAAPVCSFRSRVKFTDM